MPLKHKVLATILLPVLLITLILTWTSYSDLKKQITASVSTDTQRVVHDANVTLNAWLKSKIAVVESFSQLSANQTNLLPLMLQAERSGDYDIFYLGREDGSFAFSKPDIQQLLEDKGFDARTRPWYQQARQNNITIITEPYADANSGQLVLSVATPMQTNGRFSGVVAADLGLTEAIETIQSIKLSNTGFVMLVDQKGTIIAHPDKAMSMKPVVDIGQELNQDMIQRLAEQGNMVTQSLNGIQHLIRFEQVGSSRFYAGIALNKAEVMAPLSHLLLVNGIVSLVLIIISAIISMIIISRVLKPLHSIGQALEEIAQGEGDLTKRLNVESRDEVGALAAHFNHFVDSMHRIIKEISELTINLRTTANASAQVAERTSQDVINQMEEVSMVASAVQEMATATHEIAGNAENTAVASQQCASASQEGQHVVENSRKSIDNLAGQISDAASVIDKLSEHAQQINSILSTIQDIAEQTNLLALNAAIEAARAGEQGRGFAVVADEVRVLSQRTHQSTEEIQEMINSLQKASSEAVHFMSSSQQQAAISVEEASSAYEKLTYITQAITEISDMSTQTAAATEEQSLVNRNITDNTMRIKNIADQLSDESEQAKARAGQLNQLADNLHDQIRRFSL